MTLGLSHVIIEKQTALRLLTFGLLGLIVIIGLNIMSSEAFIGEGWALVLLSWLGVLLFVWSLITWYAIRKEVLCPYTLFLCCSYIFMYGQSFLWAFGIEGIPDLRNSFPTYQIVRAQVFTLLSLGFFHAGALYSAKKRSYNVDSIEHNDDRTRNLCKSVKIIGWILFVISVIPFSILMINQMMLTHSYGYGVLYDPDLIRVGFEAIGIKIANLFIPSLICLFIGYSRNRLFVLFILILMTVRVAIAFYVGGRSPAMALILCALCMWHYLVRRITVKGGLLLLPFVYLLMSLLPAVALVRSEAERSVGEYISAFTYSIGRSEQFIKAISELGGSMFPLIQTMNLVPSQYAFRYGGSYFYSVFSLVPNLGFWDVHPAFKKANLGDWLQEALSLSYGPGFSLAAEAYINFGWSGILAMFVLGVFYGWAFTLIDKSSALQRPDLASFVFVLFSFLVLTTRNSFIATVRVVIYYAAPIYVFALILSRYANKKRLSNLPKHIYKSTQE